MHSFDVCDRVCLQPPLVPAQICGMVASVAVTTVVIATDHGQWVTVPLKEVGSTVAREESPTAGGGVVALCVNHFNKQVVGMFLGESDEFVLQGGMNAYLAHVARPMERDARLREDPKAKFANQSFSLGDIVVPVSADGKMQHEGPHVAAVVRVLYSRRVGNSQARKLLLLCELEHAAASVSLPDSKEFFPASWGSWTPKLKAGGGSENETLSKSLIRALDKVCTP